jgi:hypothetical protein
MAANEGDFKKKDAELLQPCGLPVEPAPTRNTPDCLGQDSALELLIENLGTFLGAVGIAHSVWESGALDLGFSSQQAWHDQARKTVIRCRAEVRACLEKCPAPRIVPPAGQAKEQWIADLLDCIEKAWHLLRFTYAIQPRAVVDDFESQRLQQEMLTLFPVPYDTIRDAWLHLQHVKIALKVVENNEARFDKVPQDETEVAFMRDGDGYFIRGFGESGHVTRLRGFDIIARLVRTPSVPVPMLELFGGALDKGIAADQRSRQETLDSQAVKDIRNRLAELRADYDKAEAKNNTVEMTSAETQIEELKSRLLADTGLAGRSRDMNSDNDRLRPTIYGNLKRAYQKLLSTKPPMVQLANYFEQTISSRGGAFIYSPGTPIDWASPAPPKL